MTALFAVSECINLSIKMISLKCIENNQALVIVQFLVRYSVTYLSSTKCFFVGIIVNHRLANYLIQNCQHDRAAICKMNHFLDNESFPWRPQRNGNTSFLNKINCLQSEFIDDSLPKTHCNLVRHVLTRKLLFKLGIIDLSVSAPPRKPFITSNSQPANIQLNEVNETQLYAAIEWKNNCRVSFHLHERHSAILLIHRSSNSLLAADNIF